MKARVLYTALLVLVLVPFFPPLVRGEIFTLRDHTGYFIPLRHYTTQHLLAGELPFWNSLNAGGEKWLANPQTAVFYPPALLFLVLPFAAAYVIYLALHVGVLSVGAFVLFRRWVDEAPAFFAAAALALSGPVMSILDVSNNLGTFAWFPLVIWAALRRSEKSDDTRAIDSQPSLGMTSGSSLDNELSGHSAPGGVRATLPIAVPAALLAMLFLGGEPFLAGAGGAIYSAIALGRRRLAGIREIITVGSLGALLSMVQLIPFIEMLMGSDRDGGFGRELAFRESLAPIDWTLLSLSPALFGRGGLIASSQDYIPILYIGTAVVFLAILAVGQATLRPGAHRRTTLAWSALLVFVAILAAGSHLGAGVRILEALGMNVSRYPARLLPLGALSVCALAAIGAHSLREISSRVRAGSVLVMTGMIGVVIFAYGPLEIPASPEAVFLLVAQCVLLVMILIRPHQKGLVYVLAAVVAVDLMVAARPLLGTSPYPLEPPAIAKVLDSSKKIARLPDLEQLSREARYDSMPGYANLLSGIHSFSTAAPVSDRDALRFHEEALFTPRPDLLRFLSVGYIIAARPISSPDIAPYFASGSMHAYALVDSWPMVTGWRVNSPKLNQLDAALREESTVSIAGVRPDFAGHVEKFGSDHAVVRITTDAPAVVVLNQLDARGWSVRVNGEIAGGLTVGNLFRAVRVPAGDHIVQWSYRPPYFFAGVVISLLTAMFLVAITIHLSRSARGVVGLRNRRARH